MGAQEPTFPLVARRRVAGFAYGALRSVRRGAGADFAGTREYRPGDDVRRIDRHASARLSSARDADVFLVREHYAAELARVVCVLDRRPSMALFPPPLPWLRKPEAAAAAARLVAASAAACRCSFLLATTDAPGELHEGREALERIEAPGSFDAERDGIERTFAALAARRILTPGSFVFVVSDLCASPGEGVWLDALARGWDLVPVLLQDPRWERSFPEVGGAVLPVGDPDGERMRPVRPTRAEAADRRERNEARFAALLDGFARLGVDPVVPDGGERGELFSALCRWADRRGGGARIAL